MENSLEEILLRRRKRNKALLGGVGAVLLAVLGLVAWNNRPSTQNAAAASEKVPAEGSAMDIEQAREKASMDRLNQMMKHSHPRTTPHYQIDDIK